MFTVNSLPVAIAFCVITMLGWGSWANTQKLAGKEKWPFELFYWDYAIGVFLCGLVFAHTLGTFGPSGPGAVENLHSANFDFVLPALISGAIFNLSNLLLVVGIDAAGMAVAFPVGVGLALVIGTVESFIEAPKGNATLLFAGVALIVFAMVMSGAAHRRLPHPGARSPLRGLVYSAIAGCIMGLFYPQLMRAISPNFNSAPIVPGMLTPYVGLACFGAGVLASNLIWNTVFMRAGHVTYGDYFRGSAKTARDRDAGRRHLDGGPDLQRHCIQRRRTGDFLCAGPGRHPGRRPLGPLHLARVPHRAGRHQQVPGADAGRVQLRVDPDRRRVPVRRGRSHELNFRGGRKRRRPKTRRARARESR
jgi:glucose uptake protein